MRVTLTAAAAVLTIADLPKSVACRTTIDEVTGCWLVGGGLDKDGYAVAFGQRAHRWIWLTYVGEIPAATPVLDHVRERGCVHRNCINVAHLEPVTVRENTMRGCSPSARNAVKDRCDHGHEFDLYNTIWYDDGRRDCRKCAARRVREYQARQREKVTQLLPAERLAELGRAA